MAKASSSGSVQSTRGRQVCMSEKDERKMIRNVGVEDSGLTEGEEEEEEEGHVTCIILTKWLQHGLMHS